MVKWVYDRSRVPEADPMTDDYPIPYDGPVYVGVEGDEPELVDAPLPEGRADGPLAAWVSWRAGGMAETQVGVRSTAYQGGWCVPQGVVPDEWVVSVAPIAPVVAVPEADVCHCGRLIGFAACSGPCEPATDHAWKDGYNKAVVDRLSLAAPVAVPAAGEREEK